MEYIDKTWYDCAINFTEQYVGKKHQAFTLFDVGAGNSVLKERVEELGGEWVGFDYKPRQQNIIKLDLEHPYDEKVTEKKPDIVLLLEVIEHVMNPGLAMKNISQMTPKGSFLIVTTPNPFWSIVRIKFLLMNKFPMFEEADMIGNHHVFTAWPHVLKKLLKDNGFRLEREFTNGYRAKFPKFQLSLKYFGRIVVFLLRRCLEYFSPISKGMSYGIVAVKE